MTQKPVLGGEVGARALRNPEWRREEGRVDDSVGTYKRARRDVMGRVRFYECRATGLRRPVNNHVGVTVRRSCLPP